MPIGSVRFLVVAVSLTVVSCSAVAPRRLVPAIGTEGDPEARQRWYWEQRARPTGSIPAGVHREAIRAEVSRTRALSGGEELWESLGPAPLRDIPYYGSRQDASGRALAVAIHPHDPATIFLGTAQGGLWKSTDGGATFRPIREETLPSLAINLIRFHPTDPRVMVAGTGEPNGGTSVYGAGLLRSEDGGETWAALPARGDGWDFEYGAITGLHFDPRDPSTLYVSTASIASARGVFTVPPDPPQTGVFRSTDGGASWALLLAATRHSVGGNPAPSAGIVDFEYGGAAGPGLMVVSEYHGGLLKSTDGGASWTRITPQKPTGLGAFPDDVPRLYRLESAGRERLVERLPNPDDVPDFRRVEVGMSPADLDVLYAGYDSSNTRLDLDENGAWSPPNDREVRRSLLFKSDDGGRTWRWLGSQERGIPDYCGAQCSYDNVITVNPEDANDVLIGGQAQYASLVPDPADASRLVELPWRGMIYRSRDGGASWVDLTPHCTRLETTSWLEIGGKPVFQCAEASASKVIHPDTHAIVLGPAGEIYVANDGGLYRGTTVQPAAGGRRRRGAPRGPPGPPFAGLTTTWENLNEGLSTLQFYRVASHPTDPGILLGGMQDNSCGYWNGEVWEGWGGGDGTVAAFDPKDPRYVYLGYQFGVARHDGGGSKDFDDGWVDLLSRPFGEAGEQATFVPVFAIDPVEPSIVYAASTAGLYRSTNRGDEFRRIASGQTTDGAITSVSVSPLDHAVVWAGTANGAVYRYDVAPIGTAVASDVRGDLPNRWVSAVAAGHAGASTVYAAFNGYDANTPGRPGKVFVSEDGGVSWTNISGNLPDVPVIAIALHPFDPNRIWVATDIAVFSTQDHGTTWVSERRNMPVVGVQDLHYNANTGYLVAATHGRGVWRLAVGAAPASPRATR